MNLICNQSSPQVQKGLCALFCGDSPLVTRVNGMIMIMVNVANSDNAVCRPRRLRLLVSEGVRVA